MKEKICFVGRVSFDKAFDGQTIRTTLFYNELIKTNMFDIHLINTEYALRRKVHFVIRLFFACLRNKKIIMMVSDRGRTFLFSFFKYMRLFRKNLVYHNVIGGNFHSEISKKNIKVVNSFVVNWVQTKHLREELKRVGISNSCVLPNFRENKCVHSIIPYTDSILKYVIFSRISEAKGITDAIRSICEINAKNQKHLAELYIYGKIDEEYKSDFFKLVNDNHETIFYCGAIESSKSTEIIRDYYCLLFPTKWVGEGFPGTILDSYFAAVPVIASDWNCNSEMVYQNNTGIIYPSNGILSLTDAIDYSINHINLFNSMKSNCLKESQKYTSDIFMPKISNFIYKNLSYDEW